MQESIAKAIEEKISGEQRRFLLNEQLKAIKKVLLCCPRLYFFEILMVQFSLVIHNVEMKT